MVSLRSSLINIWSLLSGQVVSNTSCLWFADYFTVAVCEFAWSRLSASFKPMRACCFSFCGYYNRILIKDTTCGLYVPRNQLGEDYGLFSLCSHNNITSDKREKHFNICAGPDHRVIAPYLLFCSSQKKQHMLCWSACSQRTDSCLLSGSLFSRDIFISTIADINDGNVINLMMLFNNHMNVIEAALCNIFIHKGWNYCV